MACLYYDDQQDIMCLFHVHSTHELYSPAGINISTAHLKLTFIPHDFTGTNLLEAQTQIIFQK